jgi:hypothetical protein
LSELQIGFPPPKELGCRQQISEAILRNFPKMFLREQSSNVQTGDAVGLWAVDPKGLAVEIQAEFPERAMEGELIEQVAMNRIIVPVRHEIA